MFCGMYYITVSTIFGVAVGVDFICDDDLQEDQFDWCFTLHLFAVRLNFFHCRTELEPD